MILVIDYGSGNLRSVVKSLEHVVPNAQSVNVSRETFSLKNASHIILPGVGAFADCINGLKAIPGMVDALSEQVLHKKTPFLGICVGMQMLFEQGHEHGVHQGLGWLSGNVLPLSPTHALKIPHMGWNELEIRVDHPLLKGISGGDHAYFVHSYAAECKAPNDVLASTQYGQMIPAVVGRDNIMGTQFHPEKSQQTGLSLLSNFLKM